MCLTLFRQLNFFRYIVLKIENRSSETKAHILKKPSKIPITTRPHLSINYDLRRDLGVTFVPVRSILIYVYLEKNIDTFVFSRGIITEICPHNLSQD